MRMVSPAARRDLMRRIVDAAAEEAGIPTRIAFEVQSVQATKALVADGRGVTVMPYGTVLAELKAGTLAGYRIADTRLERTLYLVRPEKRAAGVQEERLLGLLDGMRDRL